MWCRLLNHNFKVFFKAISRIKQARRLIFSMSIDINLIRWNTEKRLELCWGRLPYYNFKVFFIAISRCDVTSGDWMAPYAYQLHSNWVAAWLLRIGCVTLRHDIWALDGSVCIPALFYLGCGLTNEDRICHDASWEIPPDHSGHMT